jgi:hypothetical protein
MRTHTHGITISGHVFGYCLNRGGTYTTGHVNSVQGLKIHVSELLQNERSNVANTGRKSQMCWEGYELQRINDFD